HASTASGETPEERVRRFEEIARAAVEAQLRTELGAEPLTGPAQRQPAAPRPRPASGGAGNGPQQVFLHQASIPTFSPKGIRQWISAARGALAPLTYGQALAALHKSLGPHYNRVVTRYGATPATLEEWWQAIELVYPPTAPETAEDT